MTTISTYKLGSYNMSDCSRHQKEVFLNITCLKIAYLRTKTVSEVQIF